MLEASEDDEEDDEDDEEDEDEDETDWDGVENDVLEYERIRRSETKPVEVKSWPKTLGECSSEENREKVIFFTSEDMQSTRKALKKFWRAFHLVFFRLGPISPLHLPRIPQDGPRLLCSTPKFGLCQQATPTLNELCQK